MSEIGRNDPCPCGSGKKYKRCCLLAAGTPSGSWTLAERQGVQIALGRFGWRHEFDGDRAVAEARFWPGLDLVPKDERAEVRKQGEVFFQDWFTTDFRLGSGQTASRSTRGSTSSTCGRASASGCRSGSLPVRWSSGTCWRPA